MNQERSLTILTNFVDNRLTVMSYIDVLNSEDIALQTREIGDIGYTKSLMQSRISKLSNFSDSIWDFNEDYPNASRNIQGARLRIDFSKYSEIPIFVLTEIKILLNFALINSLIFNQNFKNTSYNNPQKRILKSNLKPQSLTPVFSTGLAFLNLVFKEANIELGKEFVRDNIKTLADVNHEMYSNAAQKFELVKSRNLEDFFKYLYSSTALDYVFEKQLPYLDLEKLNWKKLRVNNNKKKNQILSNKVFEKLSKTSSFIVLDFLAAIGDKEKISDIASFERLTSSNYPSLAGQNKINREILDSYTAMRLKNKGYDLNKVGDIGESLKLLHSYSSKSELRNSFHRIGYKIKSINEYFNTLSYACLYLVGQFTGMRPSELAEVRVNNCDCLIQINGIWLIESTIKKHVQEINTGLFDDRWVAIPIVRDAVLAASYISKIKASPYLTSNVNTVPPNEKARPMVSKGIKYQIKKLISQVLGSETASTIDFNTYMLRHTLAYQLFRADAGLTLISFQLKHFVDNVAKYTSQGATSSVTLGYGEIGEMLSIDGSRKGNGSVFRQEAELEAIKVAHNPNGTYYGGKANELKDRLTKLFQGYMAAGYTEEEVYKAMVDQGIGVVNVGQGLCYGGRSEEYDASLPCVGSLRCNPARCKQAVVTQSHAPRWREVYILNKANLNKPEYAHNRDQILAVMQEAKMVLEKLDEELEL